MVKQQFDFVQQGVERRQKGPEEMVLASSMPLLCLSARPVSLAQARI
jgi:hypothetical protein